MTEPEGPVRVLALVAGLPTREHPYAWSHVIRQMEEIGKACHLVVVAPVAARLPFKGGPGGPHVEALVLDGSSGTTTTYYRPRYFDLPGLITSVLRYLRLAEKPVPWVYHLRDWSIFCSVAAVIVRKRIRFDLIHAHFAYWPGYVGCLLSKAFRRKLIVTVHGSDVEPTGRDDIDERRRWIRIVRGLTAAALITAVSRALAARIAALRGDLAAKVRVVPMGINCATFRPMDQGICRRDLGLAPDGKYLVFIGRLARVKGPDLLLEACRVVRKTRDDVTALIVGHGELYEDLRTKVETYRLRDRVFFAGAVPNERMPLYLNAADLVVIPSRREGRSMVALEALSCGRPVVAFDVGGVAETLSDGTLACLAPPEDVGALAGAILAALDRGWERAKLRRTAEQYDVARIAQIFVREYATVLDSRSAP